MNQQTFELEFKQGQLIIPPSIQAYLSNSSEDVKISLTIESKVKEQSTLTDAWNQWFEEVEKLEAITNNSEIEDYQKLLVNKYKAQGLEL
ncbi:MAG: hypothetical protein AB4041_10390 [Microcystaceae cyanobacterium]